MTNPESGDFFQIQFISSENAMGIDTGEFLTIDEFALFEDLPLSNNWSNDQQLVEVFTIESSNLDIRESTDLKIDFQVPDYDTLTEYLNFISVELPWQWGNVLWGGSDILGSP